MKNRPTNERGLILGVVLILIPVAIFVAKVSFDAHIRAPRANTGIILAGIYLQYLGILFLLSYFFSHKTFLLRGLEWVCELFTIGPGRWRAIYNFFLGMLFGSFLIAKGFGLEFNIKDTQQAGPGYPPQGVGSPDP